MTELTVYGMNQSKPSIEFMEAHFFNRKATPEEYRTEQGVAVTIRYRFSTYRNCKSQPAAQVHEKERKRP